MTNVVQFPNGKLDTLAVLDNARIADLDEVIVIGRTKGELMFLASSYESDAYVLFELMQAQRIVLGDE